MPTFGAVAGLGSDLQAFDLAKHAQGRSHADLSRWRVAVDELASLTGGAAGVRGVVDR